jgi:hypothetical protein
MNVLISNKLRNILMMIAQKWPARTPARGSAPWLVFLPSRKMERENSMQER